MNFWMHVSYLEYTEDIESSATRKPTETCYKQWDAYKCGFHYGYIFIESDYIKTIEKLPGVKL